jgi:hypothetical protein
MQPLMKLLEPVQGQAVKRSQEQVPAVLLCCYLLQVLG